MNAHQKTRQPRFVLVSSYFPPIVGGTSTVLRNLVSQISPDDVSVITEYRELHADAPRADTPSGVNIKTTSLPPALFRRVPYIWRWERYLRFAIILRVRDLTLRAIRRNRPDCILGIYPNWPFLIGAYLAHRSSGLPLVTYHMDIPVRRSAMSAFEGWFIETFEEKILRASRERLIISGGYGQDFSCRFGLSSTLLPHSIELDTIRTRLKDLPEPPTSGPTRIVHTGIVEGQREGLLRIARTINENPKLDARLILSTPTPKKRLLQQGFNLPCVDILSLPQEKVLALQASAHILTSVLPFFHNTKEGALTGYPTKVVEYLAVDRPILIHAPAWTHLCKHVKEYKYAQIADQPTSGSITEAINKIRTDRDHTEKLIKNARNIATNFDIKTIHRKFIQILSINL